MVSELLGPQMSILLEWAGVTGQTGAGAEDSPLGTSHGSLAPGSHPLGCCMLSFVSGVCASEQGRQASERRFLSDPLVSLPPHPLPQRSRQSRVPRMSGAGGRELEGLSDSWSREHRQTTVGKCRKLCVQRVPGRGGNAQAVPGEKEETATPHPQPRPLARGVGPEAGLRKPGDLPRDGRQDQGFQATQPGSVPGQSSLGGLETPRGLMCPPVSQGRRVALA